MINGEGPVDAKIWFIGDCPRKKEIDTGRPFQTPAGQLLRNTIIGLGIDEEQCRFEYLIGVRPSEKSNDFKLFLDGGDREEFLEMQIEALRNRIRECRPNLVVCLGNYSLQYLMKEKNINNWRGHVVFSKDLGVKCMATYNMNSVMKQLKLPKGNHAGQFEVLFRTDLAKAKKEMQTDDTNYPEYELITKPSYQQAIQLMERIYNEATILSYDIEMVKDTPLMDCISFSWNEQEAVSIPLWVLIGDRDCVNYWKTLEEQASVLAWIKKLLESQIPKVAQNSQFDTVMLKFHYGIEVRNLVWDTMVAAHNLYCDLPKGLGTLISLYTELPYQKYLIHEGGSQNRWDYNAMDSLAALHIMNKQIEEAEELGVLDHYRNVTNPIIRCLCEMQLAGIKVDEELREYSMQHEQRVMDEVLWVLDKVFPKPFSKKPKDGHKFNPGSPQDKVRLFYGVFKQKKKRNRGVITVDEKALLSISESRKIYISLLAKICIRYRQAQSMRGKLKTPLLNGRMHTAYDVSGTETGRLNSKKSVLGSGTNLQNLKKGVQRQMLVAG